MADPMPSASASTPTRRIPTPAERWDTIERTINTRGEEILAAGDPIEILALNTARKAVKALRRRDRERPSRATESPIEGRFLTAVHAAQVITAAPQVRLGRYRVDFVCRLNVDTPERERAVVVELDGHEWHERTPQQAARDKKRDRDLLALGYPVMRFTGTEVNTDPQRCVREVHTALLEGV